MLINRSYLLKYYFIVFLSFIFLLSCRSSGEAEKNSAPESRTSSDTSLQTVTKIHSTKPQKLPDTFRQSHKIDAWQDFKNFEDSMESLAELNTDDLTVFLTELDSTLLVLKIKGMPTTFDYPQINSRLKVVRTYLLKAKHFTNQSEEDSLIIALESLFKSYNAFLDRMVSITEEDPFDEEENTVRDSLKVE